MEKNNELIYGEISPLGMKQLANLEPNCKNFLDIGSGYGKFPWVMANFFGAKKGYGIEIDFDKHNVAEKHFGGRYHKNVKFIHGDFKNYPEIIKKSDVIFSNAICFKYETVKHLVSMLSDNCTFYHNSSRYYFKNKEKHTEIIPFDVQWVRGLQNFYKINTNTNR